MTLPLAYQLKLLSKINDFDVGFPESDYTLFESEASLPTACFSYDANAEAFATPVPPTRRGNKDKVDA